MYKQQNYKIYEAKTNRTRKRNKITVAAGDLNTLLSTIDRTSKKKTTKYHETNVNKDTKY